MVIFYSLLLPTNHPDIKPAQPARAEKAAAAASRLLPQSELAWHFSFSLHVQEATMASSSDTALVIVYASNSPFLSLHGAFSNFVMLLWFDRLLYLMMNQSFTQRRAERLLAS